MPPSAPETTNGGDGEPSTKKARTEPPPYDGTDLELKTINTIRAFCADMVQKANSGHPGAPMGCAPMAYLLWGEIMRYSPSDPKWRNRDRFVLSNGHACALQYAMLHMTGYGVSLEDCQSFRKLGSVTPGHPESFATPGIEVCTGPLGQGISNAVGLAIGEVHMSNATPYGTANLIDNYTYVLCGDGCLQEGVSSEASSLAGHLGLGKIIVLYDDNQITIDGPTDLSFTEDVAMRYESYGWHVQTVSDVAGGLGDLRDAIKKAQEETSKPSMIKIKTVIGYGSMIEGTAKTHGAPLGDEDVAQVKTKFGLNKEEFFAVPDDVKEFWKKRVEAVEGQKKEWDDKLEAWTKEHDVDAKEMDRRYARDLIPMEKVLDALPKFEVGKDKDLATRKYSEMCLNALAPLLPELMGGSADLTPSNLTSLKCSGDFQKATPGGRYLRFGVREHGMTAICNGIYAYGAIRPFCATFLNFAGYALGAMRLSALSRFGVLFVMTHDSIGLGEDGPTHQPVEMLETLRSLPNMNVYRPGDLNETAAAYVSALEHTKTPTVICCSRSTVPGLEGSTVDKALKGGYTLVEVADAKLVLIGSGSEIGLCVEAAKKLTEAGTPTRVVSMPCQDVFLKQDETYQKSVLPGNVPTMSVEASSVYGWHRFAHYPLGLSTYGMSGKGGDVFAHFGFTTDNVVKKAESLLEYYKGKEVPDLNLRPFAMADTTELDGH